MNEYNQPRSIYFLMKALPPVIIAIFLIIYYPSLFGEFVWDDVTYFVYNDILTEMSFLDVKSVFLLPSNYWGELLPVRDYLYIVEYTMFGEWTTGYHVVSLLLFLAAGLVLLKLITELYDVYYDHLKSPSAVNPGARISAIIIMTLFLLNPIYVESVAYISGQKDLLALVFTLAAIVLLHRIGRRPANRLCFTFLIGVILHYLAVLSKLSSLSTIVFIPFLWMLTGSDDKKYILKITGIWILANIPAILWAIYDTSAAAPYAQTGWYTPLLDRFPRALNIIGFYMSHLALPWPISFGYPFDLKWTFNVHFVAAILYLLLLSFMLFKYRRSRITLGLLIFGIYMLPVLQIFPDMPNAKIYDRYLTLPAIGFFIIIEALAVKISNTWSRRLIPVSAMIVFICLSWGMITSQYIPAFNNNVASTEHQYKLYPEWNTTAFNFAYALIDAGQFDRALDLIENEKSLQSPQWVKPYFLGWIQLKKGDFDSSFPMLINASNETHRGGYYPFADIHLAELAVEKSDYKSALHFLRNILSNKLKNPVITYKARRLQYEILNRQE